MSDAILGEIRAFAFDSLPSQMQQDGWMVADGRSLNQLRYKSVYNLIRATWGSADPQNTFNIPDLRGLFLRGWTGTASVDPDAGDRLPLQSNGAAGNHVGSFQPDQFGRHTHGTGEIIPLAVDHIDRLFEHAQGGSGHPSDGPTYKGGHETRPKNVYVMSAFFAGKPDAN